MSKGVDIFIAVRKSRNQQDKESGSRELIQALEKSGGVWMVCHSNTQVDHCDSHLGFIPIFWDSAGHFTIHRDGYAVEDIWLVIWNPCRITWAQKWLGWLSHLSNWLHFLVTGKPLLYLSHIEQYLANFDKFVFPCHIFNDRPRLATIMEIHFGILLQLHQAMQMTM